MIPPSSSPKIERFAYSRRAGINGLTNDTILQILADIYTYIRATVVDRWPHGGVDRDAKQHGFTWLQAAAVLGFKVHVSTPRTTRSIRHRPPRPHRSVASRSRHARRRLVTTMSGPHWLRG